MTMDLWIILLIALLLLAALIVIAVLVLRGAIKPGAIKKDAPVEDKDLVVKQESAVASSFHSALDVLRNRVTGGSFQYRVPWVLMLGTPGSGKTAILDSLATASVNGAQQPESGLAWGFLNKGVVIDCPGSLLLGPRQGSPSDEAGWNQMLRRLNRHRPARPLDGIVLTITAAELLDPAADIAGKGSLIRAKLDHLQSAAGLVLPVYVLVTKCDSVRGFGNFCAEFEDAEPGSRKQIFGWSNDHTLESVFSWVWVDEAMNLLGRTLRAQQLRFFGSGKPLAAANELFVFPTEFETLREPLRNFLTQLFVPVSYRDSHYCRGVYFAGLPYPAGSTLPVDRGARLPLYFLEQLFDKKILEEKSLARPVAQRFFFKNRIVVGAQIFAAVFSLIMTIGLTVGTIRLSLDKQQRIYPAIRSVQASLRAPVTIDAAYNLIQTLGYLRASGFKFIFMPLSWYDPLEDRLEALLSNGFQDVVLNAAQNELSARYARLLNAPVDADPAADAPPEIDCGEKAIADIDAASLVAVDNPRYQALRTYLNQLSGLESHIRNYENLRSPGQGSIADMRELLEYLTGKTIPADGRYRNNQYFTRALRDSHWPDIKQLSLDRNRAAARAKDLTAAFYRSWFDESVFAAKVNCLADDIASFESGRLHTVAELRTVAEDIGKVDMIASGNALEWLENPFTLQSYPALNTMAAPELNVVLDEDFRTTREAEGRHAWQDLRTAVLEPQAPLTGPILDSQAATRIRVSSPVRTLGANLEYLIGLNFMAGGTQTNAAPPQTPIVWNQDLLNEALVLDDSWQKYQHDVLPTIPSTLRGAIKTVAQHNLIDGMSDLVRRARAPLVMTASSDDALLAELKNFNQTLDKRKQLQDIGEGLGTSGAPLTTSLGLVKQAARLLAAINSRVANGPLYSWQEDALKNWDGETPLSLVLYKAESPDALADSINADHDRLKTLAGYADPLVQVISDSGTPAADGKQISYWTRLSADFKQFGDKKPGNPVTALEIFLRQDVDKVTPANKCQGGPRDPRIGDPFITSLNGLRDEAVRTCLLQVRQQYIALANSFRMHLAGRFPFAPIDANAPEMDPADAANFFELFDQNGAGLIESMDRLSTLDPTYRQPARQAVDFLRAIARVRPLFATPDKNSLPALDVSAQFRTNRGHESGGNQIIDWSLRIGDQETRYQMPPQTLRWHYADRLTLTLRYANDSPRIPVATQSQSDQQIADRKVVYNYTGNWSLLSLMLKHAAAATDFDNPQAPTPNTVKLRFANAAAAPGAIPAGAGPPPDTVVFLAFSLQSPAAKDVPPKDGAARNSVIVAEFPVSAPVMP